MARDIKDVSTEELMADLPLVSGAVKARIEAELERRGTPTPPLKSAQNAAPEPSAPSPEMTVEGFLGNIGPSAMQTGTDMLRGFANLATSPIDTVTGIPAGMAQHYGDRYSSVDQAAQTAYNDPVGALMDVPVLGTGMRILGAAGKVGGAGRVADTASTVGRGLEKVDPFGAAVAGAQLGIGAGINRWGSTPAESMAGSYYGQPRGRQVENFDEYLGTVDAAIEQGIPATTQGARIAEDATKASGERLGDALKQTDKLDAIELFQQVNAKLDGMDLEIEGPARAELEKFKRDLVRMADDNGYISAADLNNLKTKYDKTINFDAELAGDALSKQQGALAGSNVARGALRESVGPEFADYSARVGVEDVVRRGAQQDLMVRGSGFTGDLFAQGINAVAPVITGQGRLKRMQGRQAVEQGRLLDAANHALDVSLYGRIREGAYLGEMSDGNEQWHVGRLWEGE
jgi:hypothetical protein